MSYDVEVAKLTHSFRDILVVLLTDPVTVVRRALLSVCKRCLVGWLEEPTTALLPLRILLASVFFSLDG